MYIYDSATPDETKVLRRLTGFETPQAFHTNSSSICVRFYSDQLIAFPGFEMKYTLSSCPSKCNENGQLLKFERNFFLLFNGEIVQDYAVERRVNVFLDFKAQIVHKELVQIIVNQTECVLVENVNAMLDFMVEIATKVPKNMKILKEICLFK